MLLNLIHDTAMILSIYIIYTHKYVCIYAMAWDDVSQACPRIPAPPKIQNVTTVSTGKK